MSRHIALRRRRTLSRDRLAVAFVLGILGILVVGQLRGQSGAPALADLSAQELTVLVANLNTRNEQLRDEVATIERQLESLRTTKGRGDSALDQLRADLARIRVWSGLTAVVGPGVTVTVRGAVGGEAIEDVLNELRNAGAEAISIGELRIVPGVVVSGGPGALSAAGTHLNDGFEIRAIGSPQILTGTLTRSGGVIAQLASTYPDASVTVTPLDTIHIPATTRDLMPGHGRPLL